MNVIDLQKRLAFIKKHVPSMEKEKKSYGSDNEKRLIFNAFASDTEQWKNDSERIKIDKQKDIYLCNSCVSLITSKLYNQSSTVALYTNIAVPKWCRDVLHKNDILIYEVPFDDFIFDDIKRWKYAFYKICVLKFLVENKEYDKLCMLDTDTICNASLDSMWKEADNGILMYRVMDKFDSDMQNKIYSEVKDLFPELDCTTRLYWAGGELAGKVDDIQELISQCDGIYKEMLKHKSYTTFGDEFFWYIADKMNQHMIIDGNAYFNHYWTLKDYYRVTTDYYVHDAIEIMHMPSEKKSMAQICIYYIRHGHMPLKRKIWHMLNLPSPDGKIYIYAVIHDELKNMVKGYLIDKAHKYEFQLEKSKMGE